MTGYRKKRGSQRVCGMLSLSTSHLQLEWSGVTLDFSDQAGELVAAVLEIIEHIGTRAGRA